MAAVRAIAINPSRLRALRGKRSREDIAHQLRSRGHGTDAKAIWRYEAGRSQPNARILPDYAAVLGAKSVDELYISDDDDEEAASMPLARDLASALQAEVERQVRAALDRVAAG